MDFQEIVFQLDIIELFCNDYEDVSPLTINKKNYLNYLIVFLWL